MYVHGILSNLGTVDFDGASLIGTACPHAVPQKIPNDRGQSPFPRKGLPPAPAESAGFWQDICNDGDGMSFHRVQVVIWTVVLGAVFIRFFANGMSMPEFPETLLALLGISNGTYWGFNIPETS